MKDAKGHGSESRGGAAHQDGVLRQVPRVARAFAKDQGHAAPVESKFLTALRGYIRSPANGVDPFWDALSHLSTVIEHLGEHDK